MSTARAEPTVYPPSRYLEKVSLATGEVLDDEILPKHLLVSNHRDYHLVDVNARYAMSWLVEATGDEEGVRKAMKGVRELGKKAFDGLAAAIGTRASDKLGQTLFGFKEKEYFFRYKKHALSSEEIAEALARMRAEARERAEAAAVDGRPALRLLLTGGTGFVGKEILWQAVRDDDIAEIVVVIRPKTIRDRKTKEVIKVLSPSDRGEDLLRQLWLSDHPGRSKVRFCGGDIEAPRLGIEDEEIERLKSTLTHVIHCAASVSFDDPYERSFVANVAGSLNALSFSLDLQNAENSPFVAHIAIETSYIHGRQVRTLAREDEVVFPRNFYNNYYELTKAMASIETERFMLEQGLRIVQCCPAIVIGETRTGNNRGDTKVVNAPVNVFGKAQEALTDETASLTDRSKARMLARMACIFPGDPSAELNLVPVDRVAAGIIQSVKRPDAVGARIHLATDNRITSERIAQIVQEEIGVEVRLAEPTLHRTVALPILTRLLTAAKQERLAKGLEKLGTIFGGYSEWGQPIHEVGNDVEVLGLSPERPITEHAFRMLCRHNRYVQRFGQVWDLDDLSLREKVWAGFIDRVEDKDGTAAGALDADAFRDALQVHIDLEHFALRDLTHGPAVIPADGGDEPFTAADAAWLRMDDPTNLMQITGVLGFDGQLDVGRLKKVVRGHLLPHDRFRSRAVDGGMSAPHWVCDTDLDLDRHVEHGTIKGGRAALRARVSELLSTPLDRDHPLWHFQVLDSDEGSYLVVRLHHAIADGIALVRLLLAATDSEAEPHVVAPRVSTPEEKHGFIASSWRLAKGLVTTGQMLLAHPTRVFELARKQATAAGELAHLVGLQADPDTPLRGSLGKPKLAVWSDPIPLEEIKRVRASIGATVNDVLVSVLAGALRRYLTARGHAPTDALEIRAIVPVDLRRDNDPPLGNRFGLVFLALPIGVADPLARVTELKRRMDALKESPGAVVAFGALTALGVVPEALQRRAVELFGQKATAVVTNVPGPREVRRLAGVPIREIMFWVPQSGRLGLGVSIISYAGQVRIGVAADAGLIPDPDALVRAYHDAFEELREAAGSA